MPLIIERADATELRVKTTDDLIEWWVVRACQQHEASRYSPYEDRSSIIARGDSLYHYGQHFELARILRKPNGKPRLFLLNGDSYNGTGGFGPSTASRQDTVRRLAEKTNVPTLVIPFSALDSAGIHYDTITVVAKNDDRYETIHHHAERPPGDVREDGSADITKLAQHERRDWSGTDSNRAHKDEDGVWRWVTKRHWLGDSLIRGRATEHRERKATRRERALYEAWEAWQTEHHGLRDEEQRLRRETSNVIWIDTLYEREEQARLGEDPAPRPTADELESARKAVDDAEAAVREHGMTEPRVDIDVRRRPDGIVVRETVRKFATYVSSFDYNEPRPLYFLAEIPRTVRRDGARYTTKPQTVEQALDDLRPDPVVQAERSGLTVIRQGDVFAIPTSLTTRELTARAQEFELTRYYEEVTTESGETVRIDDLAHRHGVITGSRMLPERYTVLRRKSVRVLDTNHKVTEVVVTTDGDTYARGIMRHDPVGWRSADHRNVTLGDRRTWYRLVKNTVESNRAWSISGNVD